MPARFSFGRAAGQSVVAERLRRRRSRRPYSALWSPFRWLALLLWTVGAAHATSVVSPSFSELVGEAQVIARGTVTSVTSQWVASSAGPVIKTFVAFKVEKQLKGAAADALTLEFLGGTVGPDTMHVSGMPEFKVGDTEILFVTGNGVQLCPLVRMMHGRYRVRTDNASHRKYVARDDDQPLTSVDDVQLPMEDHHTTQRARNPTDALTPDNFEAQVTTEVGRHGR